MPGDKQRLPIGVAVVLGLGGCINFTGGTGVHVPISGAPTRVVSGSLLVGGWYAIRDRYVVELDMGYELGPLGDHSNSLLMAGGRFSTPSRGWRPGYYGLALVGAPFPNDFKNPDAGPTGGAFHGGAGVAWSSFSEEGGDFGPQRYGSILVGLALYHQDQSNIGTGDFLGIELAVVSGGNLPQAYSHDH